MLPEEQSHLTTTAMQEALLLAPYALHSADSRGRKHPEPLHAYRGPYQRDRDRILHSAAFRRLSGKMQVFTGDMGDYHRTRLTHTHEVASIARTMGRALRLNEDLIEALALLHDIGHPPFGHAGEVALNDCLAESGGFSHNRYALTLVEELESRYPEFPGLNLSWEVLEGQAARFAEPNGTPVPPLEAQVVDLADSITYAAHDTDDAVKLGMVSLAGLEQIPLIHELVECVRRRWGCLRNKLMRKMIVHELIDRAVGDVLEFSGAALATSDFQSSDEVLRAGFRLSFTDAWASAQQVLGTFLYEQVYRHPRLVSERNAAQQRLKQMFAWLAGHPEWLPEQFQRRRQLVGTDNSVGEYLAGMTDRYCDRQYERLCELSGAGG